MPIFTPLQISKLVELAKRGRVAPLYIFLGPEDIVKEKAKEIYQVLREKDSLLEVYDLKEKEDRNNFYKIGVFQEGLFGIRKTYLILGGENILPEKGEEIVKILTKFNGLFSWIIIAEKMEESHPLYRYALEKGVIIPSFYKKAEDFLEVELINTLKNSKKIMDKSSANLFISLVGEDFKYFKNELEKLILYTEDREIITEEDIWQVVVPLEGSAIYLLGDLFFNYGPERVYRFTLHLLDMGISPPQIIGFWYRFFKRMQILREVLKKYPELEEEKFYANFSKRWLEILENPVEDLPRVIAELKPYALFNLKKHLKRISNLDNIFEELLQADLAIKREFKNPQKVFFEFYFKVFQEIAKK
ncbi:MAG: hypothetical protein NZ530_00840 [Thermodesulfobacteriaceae bacterium]|nr:hypothetical protein [Thermodesulfobacteriaceae bacterium]MDW8136505.1 hypothetical protein [Thermodesulfobacterium sp.]